VPWLTMSGASVAAGKSLSGAGSVVIAAGTCWAKAQPEKATNSRSNGKMIFSMRENLHQGRGKSTLFIRPSVRANLEVEFRSRATGVSVAARLALVEYGPEVTRKRKENPWQKPCRNTGSASSTTSEHRIP